MQRPWGGSLHGAFERICKEADVADMKRESVVQGLTGETECGPAMKGLVSQDLSLYPKSKEIIIN